MLQGRAPLAACTGWRRTLLGRSRADAAGRLVTVLILLGVLADLVDFRGAPVGSLVTAGLLALVLQMALLARSWSVPAPPPAGIGGWLARVWSVTLAALLLWASWGSPRAG